MLRAGPHGHRVAASTPLASFWRSSPRQGRGWGEATGRVRPGLKAERGTAPGSREALGRGHERTRVGRRGERAREAAQGGPGCLAL